MMGRLRRIRIVTGVLIGQNRILLALLMLWPFLLSAVLLFASGGHPAPEDIASILQQELFYGLVLVGLGASTGLGTEIRARRVQQVLSRAVGRAEYMLALGLAAYLPFAGYLLAWLVSATALSMRGHEAPSLLLPQMLLEGATGLLLCGVGLAASVVLPQMVAAMATGVVVAGLLLAEQRLRLGGAAYTVGHTARVVAGGWDVAAVITAISVAGGIVSAAVACMLFRKKNLQGL